MAATTASLADGEGDDAAAAAAGDDARAEAVAADDDRRMPRGRVDGDTRVVEAEATRSPFVELDGSLYSFQTRKRRRRKIAKTGRWPRKTSNARRKRKRKRRRRKRRSEGGDWGVTAAADDAVVAGWDCPWRQAGNCHLSAYDTRLMTSARTK